MRDAGHRTPDIGRRTSDGEKSKNNISTPQGVDIIKLIRKKNSTSPSVLERALPGPHIYFLLSSVLPLTQLK